MSSMKAPNLRAVLVILAGCLVVFCVVVSNRPPNSTALKSWRTDFQSLALPNPVQVKSSNTNFDYQMPGVWQLPGAELLAAGFDGNSWKSMYGMIFLWTFEGSQGESVPRSQDLRDIDRDVFYLVPDQVDISM